VRYEKLGRSGLKVSRLCLGTLPFGGRTPEREACHIIDSAFDHGVNFIDTADAYNNGASEEVVGRAIVGKRDRIILATKVANIIAQVPNSGGLSRHWIQKACDDSLRRLGTDVIDIYYFHVEDPETDLAISLRAVGDLIRAGKIRSYGLSNFRTWRVGEVCRIADDLGMDRPIVSQPYYHAFYRNAEAEHLPACASFGLGVVSYSPMARGVLSGKYLPGSGPLEGSLAASGYKRFDETEWRKESLELAQKVVAHAADRGIDAGEFSVAWVLNNALISGCVAGPRTIDQWGTYLAALEYEITAEDEAFIDGLVAPGHTSTPGYTDPAFPVTGRQLRFRG
jgi:aryl-alcohol dehydrogenase-like predicted oxidoreductase